MNISELSVRKPVTVTMLYVVVLVIAAVFIPKLGIALYPSIDSPTVMVYTSLSNVGPEEMDKTVTQPILNQLSRVADVEKVTARSGTGSSRVQLEFGYDKDMEEAVDDVTSALSRISYQLPDDVTGPNIMRYSMSAMPIMRLAVTGDMNLNDLRVLAEDTVQPFLERVSGVASADVMGGAVTEIHVDVSNNRLQAYGLALTDITGAISARNIQVSNGTLTHNDMDYEIVTDEYYKSLDDIRATVISGAGADVVRLDDVADVTEVQDTRGRKVYINGTPGLYISVTNESETNPSTISKAVHAMLPQIQEQLPKGVTVEVLSDDTTLIDASMKEVYASGIEGALLAMLIIFLFLRNVRSSIIIGLSIPISIVITLAVMSIMDLTINMMTMAGLILGMGMTVDSSIVILENVNKRRSWGEKPAIAAILGSRNMLLAIVASCATTVCVFVPVLIYRADLEQYGMMFQELVLTVVASLIVSLIVSVTLVPALCGSIMKIYTRTQRPLKWKPLAALDNLFAKFFTGLENGYARALRFCVANRFIVIALVFSMMIPAIQRLSMSGMNLTPSSQADDQVNVTITLPVGTNNDVVVDYLFRFQDIVKREIPAGAIKSILIYGGSSNSGSMQINLPELGEQPMSARQIQDKLAPYQKQWSGVTVAFTAGRGPGGGSGGISIRVISDDLAAASAVCNQIVGLLEEQVPDAVNPATDLENGSPRYAITIDTDAASAAGVDVNTVSNILKTALSGSTASVFHQGADDVDIIVELTEQDLLEPTDLGAITINTSNGPMSLDNFIILKKTVSPQQIRREEGVRVNRVTANIKPGAVATVVQSQVQRLVSDNVVLPDGVKIEYEGDAADIATFGHAFVFVILLALFLVFAVMAAQFESLVDPFIIFASVPLLAIGVSFVYLVTGQVMSLYTFVGVVALVGIVVNNGIVLVDFTNQLVSRKTPVNEACVEAGRNRLQPILMTTLTTVLGMVPMAFFPGEGAESMQPICLTIVGGMCSGAFMTLFVSPTLYSVFNKRREKRYDDPESLMNQLEEVDEMERSGKKMDLIRKDAG